MAEVAEVAAPSIVGPNARASADADEESGKAKKKPSTKRHPSDFEDEVSFVQHVRETYAKDLEYDRNNRDEATADARFVAGDQWDSGVRAKRDRSSKPTLTINRLPAYVAQLVGNRRLTDTGIKIIPDTGGTKKAAQVREGLIRNIQKLSRAQYAYDKAFEQQVIGGLGNFQIHLDYAHDDVFEQDIRIAAIPNPLAVVWDRGSTDPTGTDAEHVFVVDGLSRKEFRRRYPDAVAGHWDSEAQANSSGWDTTDSVQLVSFWRMRSRPRTVAMLVDGSIEDVTELDVEEFFDVIAEDSAGNKMIREVQRKYAQLYICSSKDILEGPYDLPVQRVPVFRVSGWELFIEGDRVRWGLVRFLRDPQRLHNYWRSTIAEMLVGSPKAKWLASNAAVEGREDQWRRSHLSDDPLLVWNGESGAPPERQDPLQLQGALIEQAGTATQDIRDVANMHESSMGQQSNEVSGKAIMARQRVGEVGSVIYQDNLNAAIEEAGKVINQLIPFVYDTPRTIKVLGPDMVTEEHVKINYDTADPTKPDYDPESVDITCGKYAVSAVTGPSYVTRREEAREEMMAMVNAMPDMLSVAADKIVEAQDWPGADDIARRLRTQLPAGMISEKDMDEEQKAQQSAAAEHAEQQAQMAQQMAMLELAEKEANVELVRAKVQEAQASAREAEARAKKAETDAAKNISDIDNDRVKSTLDVVSALTPEPADNGAR